LLTLASGASVLGIIPVAFASKVKRFVDTYHFYKNQCTEIIDEIKSFINAAFFGVDPSVNESGNFKGTSNKMSKRGPAIDRRALYALALASIRKTKSGIPMNQVLYDDDHIKFKGKKKKVRLVTIMNKLLRYIFSVLKNQKPYEVRASRIHQQMLMSQSIELTAVA